MRPSALTRPGQEPSGSARSPDPFSQGPGSQPTSRRSSASNLRRAPRAANSGRSTSRAICTPGPRCRPNRPRARKIVLTDDLAILNPVDEVDSSQERIRLFLRRHRFGDDAPRPRPLLGKRWSPRARRGLARGRVCRRLRRRQGACHRAGSARFGPQTPASWPKPTGNRRKPPASGLRPTLRSACRPVSSNRSVPVPENRGVPGSSPGLAIGKVLQKSRLGKWPRRTPDRPRRYLEPFRAFSAPLGGRRCNRDARGHRRSSGRAVRGIRPAEAPRACSGGTGSADPCGSLERCFCTSTKAATTGFRRSAGTATRRQR
jgi:hypothetical protein